MKAGCKRRGCPHPRVALGLCRKHYDEQRRQPSKRRAANVSDREAYECIKAWFLVHGYGPTYRELTGCLGVKSVSSAHRRVSRLIEAGLLERVEGKSRAIRLVKE